MSQHFVTRITTALALLGLLAGCSSPQTSADNDKPSKADAQSTPTRENKPTALSTPELRKLLLTVREVPTGGWKLTNSGSDDEETSTDHDGPGVCAMDFGTIFNESTKKGIKNSPQAQETFAREDPQGILIEAVASMPNARTVASRIKSKLSQCPSKTTFTASGKKQTVHIKRLDVGEFGDVIVCRSYHSNSAGLDSNDFYGKWCLVAKDNLLFTIGAGSTFEPDQVKTDEYAKFLKAAMSKADRVS